MIHTLTIEHALYVCRNMRQIDAAEVMGIRWNEDPDELAHECFSVGGPAYCIALSDGTPAVIGGVTLISPLVGSAWCIGTDDWGRVKVETTRMARRLMRAMLGTKCHRIQAISADFHTISHDWLKFIGFNWEGTMQRFGKRGNDYFVFAMVK